MYFAKPIQFHPLKCDCCGGTAAWSLISSEGTPEILWLCHICCCKMVDKVRFIETLIQKPEPDLEEHVAYYGHEYLNYL